MRLALLALAAALAAGCAPATRVVLLPQDGGRTGAVEVKSDAGEAVLSRPYQSAEVRTRAVDVAQLDAEAVQKRYGQLLSVQPAFAVQRLRFMRALLFSDEAVAAITDGLVASGLSLADK